MKYLCLVVKVSFDKSKYTYSENHGTVNDMNLKLNTSIAQSLTVGIKGIYIKTLSYYLYLVEAILQRCCPGYKL